jgi:oligo-1,6-glucosidase/alpha-glucosidase
LRAIAAGYDEERLLVGEIYLPNDRLCAWYGAPEAPEVHLPFNFALIENRWDATTLRQVIGDYEAALPGWGWPNWVIGNHDSPRVAARIGEAQARVAAVLLLTLRGTPTLYQGDELAIGRCEIPPERVHDPRELRQPGIGLGRDPARTPMPWDAGAHAGFSTAEPWLPLNPDWPTRNAAAQERDPGSMLNLYKRLLALRRDRAALTLGELRLLAAPDGVLAYERSLEGQTLRILLNLTGEAVAMPWTGAPLLSTLAGAPERGTLRADEGLVIA